MLATILFIDFNLPDIQYIQRVLTQQGYGILWARSGGEAFRILEKTKVDLILLDIHLPDITGLECAAIIKNRFQIIVAFYTNYDGNKNLVDGLEIAEDYILKSCPLDELLARIQVLLRRSSQPLCQIILPPMKLDCVRRVFTINGIAVELTPVEFNVLCLLASSPNVLVPFHVISQLVWGYPEQKNNPAIMVHISNIRKKVFRETKRFIQIDSIAGKGYRLEYHPYIGSI